MDPISGSVAAVSAGMHVSVTVVVPAKVVRGDDRQSTVLDDDVRLRTPRQ